jgi:hypothetical protein
MCARKGGDSEAAAGAGAPQPAPGVSLGARRHLTTPLTAAVVAAVVCIFLALSLAGGSLGAAAERMPRAAAHSKLAAAAAAALPEVVMDASKILMPAAEVAALGRLLEQARRAADGRMSYLEFGSGGSTTEFTKYARFAVSVEHDAAWCKLVGARLSAGGVRHVRQLCVPREEGGAGRHGGSEGDGVSFRAYLGAVGAPALPAGYDFVYVDGRARLGAALAVLPYLRESSVVVLHDAVRRRYAFVERWYEVVERVLESGDAPRSKNGFLVLRRRRDLPPGAWPLTPEQIDAVYAEIPDVEA